MELPAKCSRFCNAINLCKTSLPFSAWTSFPKRTSSPSRARVRSSASCHSHSMWPKCSPARQAYLSNSPIPSAASRVSVKENTITCRKRRSIWSAPSSRPWRKAKNSRRKLRDRMASSERGIKRRSPFAGLTTRTQQGPMATFHFDLVSPEKLLFSGEVNQVDVPGSEGDFGVLAGHAPLVTTLRPGILVIYHEGGAQRIVVEGGFAEVGPAGLTVLACMAVPVRVFH